DRRSGCGRLVAAAGRARPAPVCRAAAEPARSVQLRRARSGHDPAARRRRHVPVVDRSGGQAGVLAAAGFIHAPRRLDAVAWRAGAIFAPAWLAVALLAGESSIAVVGYLAAYALCLDRTAWRARAASLAPYLAVVIGWRIVYHALGYGTAHSGVYLDPGSDPI